MPETKKRKASTWLTLVAVFCAVLVTVMVPQSVGAAKTLDWHTFVGGTSGDQIGDIVIDDSGNILITGYSYGTWGSPLNAFTPGSDPDYPTSDIFIARLDRDGNLLWNTFLGSGEDDMALSIVLDSLGNIYVCGTSEATWGNVVLPYMGGMDAVVVKLNSNGQLIWNTFLGSATIDAVFDLVLDVNGNINLSGFSYETWGSPVLPYNDKFDGFVAQLSSTGTLNWHSFIGTLNNEYCTRLTTDGIGKLYVTGFSEGYWGTNTVRGYSSGRDAYAAAFDNSGTLLWNSFLGGSGSDTGYGITLDGAGNIYVCGTSTASWGETIRRPFASDDDGFVAKLENDGGFIWVSFLGSNLEDGCEQVVVAGNTVYVAGNSEATWGSPLRDFTYGEDEEGEPYTDIFAAALSTDGILAYHEFLGGTGYDSGSAIIYNNGAVFITGNSNEAWGGPQRAFTPGTGSDPDGWAWNDGVVAKLDQQQNTVVGGEVQPVNYLNLLLPAAGLLVLTAAALLLLIIRRQSELNR